MRKGLGFGFFSFLNQHITGEILLWNIELQHVLLFVLAARQAYLQQTQVTCDSGLEI